jgi:hypothetical protein
MAAMPRALQIGSGHANLHAAQPHPGRNRRIARRLPADHQPRHIRDKPAHPGIPEAVREFVPTADDLDPDAQYVLDGTLLPCWSWAGHEELYSGKHKTTGMNVQLACTIYGKLAWISDPVNGSRHDNYCQEESGVLLTMDPKNWIGDKGYIGNNMITPYRKPAGGELLDWQKEYNSQVNKIRWMIEQVISHFKNWTIMHTDYRRPLGTFATTISAVVGLHFYRTA